MSDEWKEMKAAGILDKLGEEPDEGMIIEMDSLSKRLLRKQRGISKEKEAANKAVAASLRLSGGEDYEEEKKEGPSQEQMLREFREKLLVVGATKEGSSLGVYSLLNEVKDKSKFFLFFISMTILLFIFFSILFFSLVFVDCILLVVFSYSFFHFSIIFFLLFLTVFYYHFFHIFVFTFFNLFL